LARAFVSHEPNYQRLRIQALLDDSAIMQDQNGANMKPLRLFNVWRLASDKKGSVHLMGGLSEKGGRKGNTTGRQPHGSSHTRCDGKAF
jgi:hypothetical protein